MKKQIIFLFVVVGFFSCETYNYNNAIYGKIGSDRKQIDQILLDGKLFKKFNYDAKKRISQIIQYSENESDTIFFSYNTDNQVSEIRYFGTYLEKFIYQDKKLIQTFSSNTQNPEWSLKSVYHYANNRMVYADKYSSENIIIGKIYFEYDKNGNTISRIEYSSNDKFKTEEFYYTYDDKQKPFLDFPNVLMDILQNNNPQTSYHYSVLMSSYPIKYGINYAYDGDDFPVSADVFSVENPSRILYTYRYKYN